MLMGSERYIVKKGRHYVLKFDNDFLYYTASTYDSWYTTIFGIALEVARVCGGKVMKFNPITGDVTGGWK